MQFVKQLFTAYSQVITSFFYIAIVLVVYIQIQRNAQLEESWLGILRNPVTTQLYYALLYGLIGGLVTSFIVLMLGITIGYQLILMIWAISLILMLFNQRYLCLSYSIGIVSLSSLIFGWPKADVPSLILLVGILHILESVLILKDGARDSVPVDIEHKAFTPAGAYIMNKMWPVPLAITTLSGPLVFPIVAVLTYEDEAITQLPHIRARESSFWIGAYGLFILSLAMISFMIPWMAYFAALATLLLHEGLFLWNRKGQRNGKPAFVAPWRGIRVLELFPERVGQRMGLKQGDIILSLNGKQVNSQAMLDEILGDYPNLIWISVKREAQEVIELEYRDYEEGINDLGAMLIPRTTGRYYLFHQTNGLFARIWGNYSNRQD